MHPAFYRIMLYSLRHIFRELLSAEDMEMKMLYRLAAVLTDIAYNSVSVGKSQLCCDFRYSGKNCRDGRGVFRIYRVSRGNMLLRHDKTMHGSLWIYVEEGVAGVVLVHLFRGNVALDYSTE